MGSGRTTGTHSRLLYDVLGAVYDWLGFGAVADPVFRDMVIARIVEPTSKLDSRRVLADLGAEAVSYKTIDRHARKVTSSGYRDVIAGKCFDYASDCGALSPAALRRDHAVLRSGNPKTTCVRSATRRNVGSTRRSSSVCWSNRTGFPLEIGCYEGNTAETTTIVPIVTSFLQRHDLGGTPIVIAADAGMLSASNLKALDELGMSFIVGSRATKAPADLESHFHWHGDVFTDGQIIDTVTPRHGNTKVNNTALRAEPVWNPEDHPGAWRAIWAYSAKRARRDQKTLAAQEARARAIVNGEKTAKSTRFVKTQGSDRSLDEATLARAQSLVGAQRLRHQRRRRDPGGRRSHRQVPQPVARREVLPHVQDRPGRPPHVQPRARCHRGTPEPSCSLRWPSRTASSSGPAWPSPGPSSNYGRCAAQPSSSTAPPKPSRPEIPETQREILTHLGFKPGY